MEEITKTLKAELERLNRLNNKLEKSIDFCFIKNEPEQIVNNVNAMCDIAFILKKLKWLK